MHASNFCRLVDKPPAITPPAPAIFAPPLTGGLINSEWASVLLRAMDYIETLMGGENIQIQEFVNRLIMGEWGNMSVPIGTVLAYGGLSLPTGWLPCNGGYYLNADYPALYSVIGSNFGGDSEGFNLPNLQGRMIVGNGYGVGLTLRSIGQLLGSETALIKIENLPAHSHNVTRRLTEGAGGGIHLTRATNSVTTDTQATSSVGGNVPLPVFPPSQVLVYMIRAT